MGAGVVEADFVTPQYSVTSETFPTIFQARMLKNIATNAFIVFAAEDPSAEAQHAAPFDLRRHLVCELHNAPHAAFSESAVIVGLGAFAARSFTRLAPASRRLHSIR